jgi:hypothetical protein
MSYLIITESEKFDILKKYGLLGEQDSFRFNRPGDKNYAPPTGPYAAPPTREEWFEPNMEIIPGIKWSVVDLLSFILNFIPHPVPYISSVVLDAASGVYFLDKGNKYEAGLRFMFLFIPVFDIPWVEKMTKSGVIKLLVKLENASKNLDNLKSIKKDEWLSIYFLAKEIYKDFGRLKIIFKKALNSVILFSKVFVKTIPYTLKKFIFILQEYHNSNPATFKSGGVKLLYSLTLMLGKMGIIIKTWDDLWNIFASEEDKWSKELDDFSNTPMSSLDKRDTLNIYRQIAANNNLSNFFLNQS